MMVRLFCETFTAVLLALLFLDCFFNDLDNNLVDFDDFFCIEFLETKLNSFIKYLSLNEVDKVVPLILFVGYLLNLSEEILGFRDEEFQGL